MSITAKEQQLQDHRKWQNPNKTRFYLAIGAVIFLITAIAISLLSPQQTRYEDNSVSELLQWLEANGAKINGLEIVDDGMGGRDIRSTRPIKEGESLVSLPRALMLGRDVCYNDAVVQAAIELAPLMSETEKLAVFVLANKHGSFWTPFIKALPKSIPLPIFWDDDGLAWLQLPHFIQSVQDTKDALVTTFETIQGVLPANTTLHDYMHAWAVVASRAWGFTIEDVQQDVLVPFFDLANHEPTGIMAAMQEDERGAHLIANRDHDLGDLIHTFYSNHSNFIFLQSYGFTLEDNDEHMSCIIEDQGQVRHLNRNLGEESDFQRFMEHYRSLSESDNVLDHELSALEQLVVLIGAIENGETSIEDDDQLLMDESLTWNQRNAVRARREEKTCWQSYKDLAETVTEVIYRPKSWAWFEARFGDWEGYESYAQHLSDILS